ncbi:MAG: transposase [Planctomycetaceae bacterium]
MQPHQRKRIRHFHEPGHLHELTFSCYQQKPLLVDESWREMLAESVDRAMTRHGYRLIAFVFMPEHVHLLVFPERDSSPIPALLKAIKRPYSYRIKQLLLEGSHPLLEELTIQQRPGVTSFRFWQEGPGYDRNIIEPGTIEASIDYIHNNPVKRGLCQRAVDWKWSSARHVLFSDSPEDPDLPKLARLPPEYVISS